MSAKIMNRPVSLETENKSILSAGHRMELLRVTPSTEFTNQNCFDNPCVLFRKNIIHAPHGRPTPVSLIVEFAKPTVPASHVLKTVCRERSLAGSLEGIASRRSGRQHCQGDRRRPGEAEP